MASLLPYIGDDLSDCISDLNRSMQFALASNSDGSVPVMGFGTWEIPDGAESEKCVATAIEAGYRLIDTAACYGNETGVGRGVRNSGVKREELFVTSKLWNTERGEKKPLAAIDATLSRMGLDYLDLYLVHWPANAVTNKDPEGLNAATWEAMLKIKDSGKVRFIGVSNFKPHHVDALLARGYEMPAVNQIEFHPGYMQTESVSYCRDKGIVVQGWSPLGRGDLLKHDVIMKISSDRGATPAQVCINWALCHGVCPITKSLTASRIINNAGAVSFLLTKQESEEIDAIAECGGLRLDPDLVEF